MDATVLAAIISVGAAVTTGIIAFFAGRRKANVEADITLIGGFQELLKEMRVENVRLAETTSRMDTARRERIIGLEADNDALVKRNGQLEMELMKHGIVPPLPTLEK